MVSLKGRAVPVMSIAVRFDYDPHVGPEEIDEAIIDEDVDLGRWNARFPAQGEEVDLKGASSVYGTWIDPLRHAPETAQAWPSAPLLQNTAQLAPAQLAALFSSNQIVLQLTVVKSRGRIEQRPLKRCDRDSALYSDVLGRQRARLMQPNAVGSPVT